MYIYSMHIYIYIPIPSPFRLVISPCIFSNSNHLSCCRHGWFCPGTCLCPESMQPLRPVCVGYPSPWCAPCRRSEWKFQSGQWLGEKNCHWWDLMLKKVRPDWAALQSGLEIWQQHDVIFHFWGFANLQLQCGKINNPIFWRFAVNIPKSQYGAWMAMNDMNGYFHGYGFYGMLNNKPAGISPLHIFVGKKSSSSLDHSPYSLYNSSSVEWQFVRPFAVNLSPWIFQLKNRSRSW